MSTPQTLLQSATHGLLLWWVGNELHTLPGALWWDGAALWCNPDSPPELPSGQAVTVLVTVSGQVVRVQGPARVYGLKDPWGLALHAPMVTTALGALALRGGVSLGSLRHPSGIAVRVRADAADLVQGQAHTSAGMTPGLPVELPSELRRALAGVREVALSWPGHEAVLVNWASGYALHGAPSGVLSARRAAVVVQRDASILVITGTLLPGPRLAPRQARWWHNGQAGESDMSTVRSAIVLPD